MESLYSSRGSFCVMSVRGANNVGGAVQTDPTLLRYASAITEQKKCWEWLAEKFDRFRTLRNKVNNTQQHPPTCNRVWKRTQHVTSNNVGSCWPTMLRPFARAFLKWHVISIIAENNQHALDKTHLYTMKVYNTRPSQFC